MPTTTLRTGAVQVVDYRCSAGPTDEPFAELHHSFSISYVRRGSFGYRVGGREFELVAGSLLVGHPGDEYVCRHDHHLTGDECLSFHFSPERAEELGAAGAAWRSGAGRCTLRAVPSASVWRCEAGPRLRLGVGSDITHSSDQLLPAGP